MAQSGEAVERGRAVERIEVDVHDREAPRLAPHRREHALQVTLGADLVAVSAPEHFRQQVIRPFVHVVVGALVDETLGGIAAVVQHEHERAGPVPRQRRQLEAGHLEGAVADHHDRPEVRPRHLRAERGGDGEAHRRVVGGAQELRALMDRQVGRAEEAVADVADDDGARVEEAVQSLEEAPHGDGCLRAGAESGERTLPARRTWRRRRATRARPVRNSPSGTSS